MEKTDIRATHSSTASTIPQTTAQVSPDPIFQMVTGYWVSKTLMTAVELDVFTKLSGNKTVTFEQLQNDILEMDIFFLKYCFLISGLLANTMKSNNNTNIFFFCYIFTQPSSG
jgi:hypothetical protein